MTGIDVGFGDVKVVYMESGELKYFKMPTAIKYAGNSSSGITEEGIRCFQGREYLVGEQARFGAFSTRSYDFLRRYTGLFVYHALKSLGLETQDVGVGLPLNWFSKKEEFLKELTQTVVDGEKLEIQPKLFPQAVGILMDYRMDIDGKTKEDTTKDGIVLDIGYNTVDVVCFERGAAVRSDAGTLEKYGISRIILELADIIYSEFSFQLSEQEAKDVFLEGKLRLYGDIKDLSEIIRSITEKYFNELLHTIESRWDSRLKRAEVMLLGGGGAVILNGYMPSALSKIISVPKYPEYSNARGYMKGLRARL